MVRDSLDRDEPTGGGMVVARVPQLGVEGLRGIDDHTGAGPTPAGTTCSTEVLQLRIDARDEMCNRRSMKIRWCGSTDRSTGAEQANRVQSGVAVVES